MKETPILTNSLVEEMAAVLFRIVRTLQQRHPLGHDLFMDARSVVRRAYPDAYKDLMKRWPDTKPSRRLPACGCGRSVDADGCTGCRSHPLDCG